jgi:beta-galactosidase/beta-glucuronidase
MVMKMQEFPNPQFERKTWECLNGEWDFQIISPKLSEKMKINVPFCVESELSGVEHKDFIKECVYERTFNVKKVDSQRLLLHFGAVYYESEIFINGKKAGRHFGGYTPFCLDITQFVCDGENTLSVRVCSDLTANQPSGKQSRKPHSYGCFYTRCTGIWQTVWLEYVPEKYVRSVKYYPHVDETSVDVELCVEDEGQVCVEVYYDGEQVGKVEEYIKCKGTYTIKLSKTYLWEPFNGRLYTVKITYGEDEVQSYFGLREVRFDGMDFLLNGKPVFQSFVLNQGYYPKGVCTPQNDEERLLDIRNAIELGFNGLRLHQKVFDPRYLYLCDKMGYMVWGEFASWGIKYDTLDALGLFLGEWREVIERDFNHPCIILWCPLNETWRDLEDDRKTRDVRFIDSVYQVTKALDATRPCVDVSGGYHGNNTDLYDFHCYESYDNLKEYLDRLEQKDELFVPLLYDKGEDTLLYRKGLPVNVSEFGGIMFSKNKAESKVSSVNEGAVQSTESWGYGEGEADETAFAQRYKDLVELIKSYKKISGFCYTQLYDVEQEENGFFTYDRKPKFSKSVVEILYECNKK